jgi:hypothetical protein
MIESSFLYCQGTGEMLEFSALGRIPTPIYEASKVRITVPEVPGRACGRRKFPGSLV